MTGFYGQISEITILPVTGICILRANSKNHHFARNPQKFCNLKMN
ncbi:hypothetical protein LRC_16530 [Ligilactobacillus ruminis ATCC 27782]|uniref:Uncharacterized protein n=1 Tax=Ligilactobacillus ruminis (strain ATCC 27782 / RF3) TaxID=1069534 RepID=G2SRU8_LIGR2|nr:hypothetical protein LRC_16530 [Ligilactobacillus ruminis ATCC 27782]